MEFAIRHDSAAVHSSHPGAALSRVGAFSIIRLQGVLMQASSRSVSFLCFLAAAVLLVRGLKLLTAGVPALWSSSYSSAHEIGYAFGQMAVPVLFIVASAGFVALGWRRMPSRNSV